jgi:hypothetical protein
MRFLDGMGLAAGGASLARREHQKHHVFSDFTYMLRMGVTVGRRCAGGIYNKKKE